MKQATFRELAGDIHISSAEASTFIRRWFKPSDKICIVGRDRRKTISQSLGAWEAAALTDQQIRDDLVFSGGSWNVYVAVAPIIDDVTTYRRGTERNVAYLPGVWADVDVKPGSFNSQTEIRDFLNGLECKPTMIVGSGSGGVHAYWKLGLAERGTKELLSRWWSYLDESAGDRQIDKLIDTARILRLPGTVYFPKTSGPLGAVRLLSEGPESYTVAQLEAASEAAYRLKQESRRVLRSREQEAPAFETLNQWTAAVHLSQLESEINERMLWSTILEPYGWRLRRTLFDGSLEWSRPGSGDRSAVTDYEGSPVMSLLSTSHDTGLFDLLESEIPLTKYRVLLRLYFADNHEALLNHYLSSKEPK